MGNTEGKVQLCLQELILKKIFYVNSLRLARFLYSLGFNKASAYDENGMEYWQFENTQEIQEAYEFFKYMRKKIRNNTL